MLDTDKTLCVFLATCLLTVLLIGCVIVLGSPSRYAPSNDAPAASFAMQR